MEINKNTLTEFRRDFKEAVASLNFFAASSPQTVT